MSWSRVVRRPEQARAALADPGDALDLRAPRRSTTRWAALGFTELVPGELVRPVPLELRRPRRHPRARPRGSPRRCGPATCVVLTGPLGAGQDGR